MLKAIKFIVPILLFCSIAPAQINTPAGAVVPFGANQTYAGGIMPTNLPTGGTYGKSTDAANAYIEWKANYVVSCGGSPNRYRVKFDEPNRTVSEGIAYGMMLAAYAADKDLFDGLWAYYKANSNGNGFMHWRIDGCSGVSGNNGATDSELDATFALLVAENQWPTLNSPYDYGTEATNMMNKIRQFEIHPSSFQAINGDGWGFGDNCRNPSYQSPAYYREFAVLNPSNASVWNSAVGAAYSLLNANANSTTGLVSDWCNNLGVRNTCNGSPLGIPTDGYGYDACRNPMRMAQDVLWNGSTTASQAASLCTKMSTYVASQGATNVRGPLFQNGNLYSGNQHNATFVSTFAMAVMGTTSANQTLMNNMYTQTRNVKDVIQNVTLSGYFGNTLRCLSLFMMTGNMWKLGTTSQRDINIAVGALDVPDGSTYDFQNQQTLPPATNGKLVTFTVQNKGFNALTLTGTPRVVLGGADASQFILTQSLPATLNGNTSVTFTVEFRPTTVGAKTATLTIASNDPDTDEATYNITLTGVGTANTTAPRISVFQELTPLAHLSTFNMGTSGTSSNNHRRFKIKNTGDAPLNITSITATPAAYSIVGTVPTTCPVNDSVYFWVRVTSTTAATPAGSFTINNSDVTRTAYQVNLNATIVACPGAFTTNEVVQDFDGNYSNSALAFSIPAWSELQLNPQVNATNPSYQAARFTRPATGTYSGVRYVMCGTTNNIAITSSKYIVSMLVYSPAANIPVLMNLKTNADVANTTTYPSTSSVKVRTTKVNQWERLYFDHSAAIGVAGIRHLEVFVDPGDVANGDPAISGGNIYFLDDIRLDVSPCLANLPATGIFNDYENQRNVSLPFAPPGTFNEVFANPATTGANTSATVAQYVRPQTTTYQIIRYKVCGNNMDLSAGKTIVSMQVYSPAVGVPVLMSLKDAATGTTINTIAEFTATTTKANQWETLYFDFTSVQGNLLVKAFDIFIDPLAANSASATASTRTYYLDNIMYAAALPCATQIPATGIFNDYDNNRYLNLAFNPVGPINEFAANPSATGINTSATVASFVRPATLLPDVIRYKACGPNFNLTPGKSVVSLMVRSSNANAEVIVSLKKANGTAEVAQAYGKTTAANTWTELNFDFSEYIGNTEAAFMDIILDPNGTNLATAAARTYYIDNIRYSAAPEINVRNGSTNVLSGDTIFFANTQVGDSLVIPLTLINNGSGDLSLNGTPALKLLGADAVHYRIVQSPSFSTTVTGGSAVGFSVIFKPLSAGVKLSAIEIANTDANENPYYINLKGLGLSPEINVTQSATTILSGGSYNFGTQLVSTSSSAVTFVIENQGNSLLTLTGTPRVAISGANAAEFSIVQPLAGTVAALGTTSFTVSFNPSSVGAKTAQLSIANDDKTGAEDPYIIVLSGTGNCPAPTVANAGADQTICSATATLAGNTPTVGTGAWSVVSGTATITNTSLPGTTVTGIGTGAVTLRWTITGAVCSTPSTDDVVITRLAAPTTANAGADQTVCGLTATLSGNTPTVGTGAWSVVTGAATFSNASSASSTVTITTGTTATLRWTVSNGVCTPSTDDVVITGVSAPSVSNAGADQTICAATATLAANVPSVGTGSWSVVSGTATITTATSAASTVTGIGTGAVTLRWTISNAPCVASTDDVIITRQAAPSTANAGADQTICAATTTLDGNIPTVGTGAWSVVSGTATITTASSATSTVTGIGVGSVTLRWTVSNGVCTPSTDDVVITRNAAPTVANAGADQSVCSSSANVSANVPAVGTGSWSVVTGTATIANASSATTSVTGLGIGSVTLRWTISNAPCVASTDDVVITNTGGLTTANAGTDQNVCGSTATLSANAAGSGNTGTWSVVSGSATITNVNSPSSSVSFTAGTSVTLRWTISNGVCTPSTDEVTINSAAAPTTANAGADQTICATTTTLAANVPTIGTGAWSVVSGTATITSASSATSTVTGIGTGAVTLRWTISNAPCVASTDDVVITGQAVPTMANAGADQAICGTTATLSGNAPTVGTGSWSVVSGTATVVTSSSATSSVTGIGVGSVTLRWTISNGVCTPSTDDVVITRAETPTTSNAGPDQSVCSSSANLSANVPTVGTGAWSVVTGTATITNASSATSSVTGLGVGSVTLRWTISNGVCSPSIDDVVITNSGGLTTADAGADQNVCGGSATLSANAAGSGNTGTWSVVSGSATIANGNSPSSSVTFTAGTSVTLRWTISNGVCTPSTDDVTINSSEAPTAANAGADISICSNNNLVLASNTPSIGTGAWTVTSGAGTFADASSANTLVSGAASVNVYTWTISNGVCPPSSDAVQVNVTTFAAANAGADQAITPGSVNLSASPASGSWSTTSGGVSFSPNASSASVVADGLTVAGSPYTFTWTVAANGPCAASSDNMTVTVTTAPAPNISITVGGNAWSNTNTYAFTNNQQIGESSAPVTVTISNTGSANLVITSITLSGVDFAIAGVSAPFFIAPSGTPVSFTVSFSPLSTGFKTGNIQINSDDSDEPSFVINLNGNGTTDVSEAFASQIQVSPNPAVDQVMIQLNEGQETTVMLRDLNGRLLQTAKGMGQLELNISEYAQGVYSLEILQGENKAVKKIVKQ
ncbi:MAG: glycosyl hydrolase family 8 [Cytophagaceae bacterium]|jgi:endo-1,4-beta-D-glucanase Y|nr:glycosyl hydrolase family 8 [Cytophagaceae bacterium]